MMKIIKMVNQHRRDFNAIYECEDCGYKVEQSGYDDRNFLDNVIPNIKCGECGKSSNTLGIKHDVTPTKYEAFAVIKKNPYLHSGEMMNDCFWYRSGTCDAGTCVRCETYLPVNSREFEVIYAEYKKDMPEAIELIRQRYVEKLLIEELAYILDLYDKSVEDGFYLANENHERL